MGKSIAVLGIGRFGKKLALSLSDMGAEVMVVDASTEVLEKMSPFVTYAIEADLKDVEDSNLGLAGSPTKIAKASDKVRKGAGEKVTPDSPEEAVSYIVGKLDEKHAI